MNRKQIAGIAAGALVIGAAAVFFLGADKETRPAYISPSDQTLVARGKAVYAANCASCHGASLEGQPNWRQRMSNGRLPAPPHDVSGHTWHHPDAMLVDIITNGLVPGRTAPDGYQSDMPGYGKTLPDSDIVAVIAYIKSTWPADALEAQKGITLQKE